MASPNPELKWYADALCAQTDPELFFPIKGGSTADAKRICNSCTVRLECLEDALKNNYIDGIWGGLGPKERSQLVRRGRGRPVKNIRIVPKHPESSRTRKRVIVDVELGEEKE
jgi:WhiB family redox-sensing transcriptional regulator